MIAPYLIVAVSLSTFLSANFSLSFPSLFFLLLFHSQTQSESKAGHFRVRFLVNLNEAILKPIPFHHRLVRGISFFLIAGRQII